MQHKEEPFATRATLLERVRLERSDESWEEFVYYYQNFLYMICRQMDLPHHDAEEAVQNVLVKVWKSLEAFEYDEGKRFRGWLCQVARNTVRDHYRKQARIERLSEKAQEGGWFESLTISELEERAEKEWADYIATMALENIRGQISDKMYETFCALARGKTPIEVSRELCISADTVYVYRKRVVEKLKAEVSRLRETLD